MALYEASDEERDEGELMGSRDVGDEGVGAFVQDV